MNRQHFNRALAALALTAGTAARARKQYDPGADDTQITIGAIHPYSGPASAYGTIGRAIGAYFDKVNAEGGIHGRRIRYLALDDGYNPAKTLEMARRLVEQEEALLVFNPLGTASNTAIQRYLNQQRVPQLFVSTGASKWNDPRAHPWTMGWHPDYPTEAGVYAQHILETRPRARIAVLYQNDDYGKDYLQGFEDGLGGQARSMIVARASYEVTDPTVDSQLVSLKAAGADVFFNVTTPKFAAQAIRRVAEMNWKPLHILNSVSSGIGSVLTPAGLANAVGAISATYYKDPTDPQFHASREYQDWLAWMKAYYPRGDLKDNLNVYAYSVAQTLVQVLRQCGDTLTRENVMRQAANLDFTLPMLLPDIAVKTAPDDYRPIERLRLMRFDGRTWVLFGKVYGR